MISGTTGLLGCADGSLLMQKKKRTALEAVARLVTSEQPEWTGSPSELAEALNTGMAANALTKYLNIKCGRLKDEYGISYENKAKHSGRRVTLTYTTK